MRARRVQYQNVVMFNQNMFLPIKTIYNTGSYRVSTSKGTQQNNSSLFTSFGLNKFEFCVRYLLNFKLLLRRVIAITEKIT